MSKTNLPNQPLMLLLVIISIITIVFALGITYLKIIEKTPNL